MKDTPFLSSRPVALPDHEASVLDYREIQFVRSGQVRYVGNCRMDGIEDGDKSVRVFFRPPQPGNRLLPEQPAAPDNADMFLTKLGLATVQVPAALTEPCTIDLETAEQPGEPVAIGGIY